MITLYKYLFYSISYVIKKYDNLWNVGDTYFVSGGMIIGLTIFVTLWSFYRIFAILFNVELLSILPGWLGWVPVIMGLSVTIYLGTTKKDVEIYNEMASMDKRKKRLYKVLNILHLLIVYGTMFLLSDYIRYYVNGFR